VIAQISPIPILIIAGEGGKLIPAENGLKLFAAAGKPKELWIIPGADNVGTFVAAGSMYGKKVGEFFDEEPKIISATEAQRSTSIISL
jgi:fermentation-respiration switch protein FrsA (DUF1100 family)